MTIDKETPEKPNKKPTRKVIPIRPGMTNATQPKLALKPRKKAKEAPKVEEEGEEPKKGTPGRKGGKLAFEGQVRQANQRLSTGLTVKEEAFCQHVAQDGGSFTSAWRKADPHSKAKAASIHAKVTKLKRNPLIMQRIEDIKREHAEDHGVTVQSIAKRLDEAIMIARETKSAAAMTQGIVALAKLYGLMVEKVESKQTSFVIEAPQTFETTEDWLSAVSNDDKGKLN